MSFCKKNRLLAIIPARGGSKGICRKNIKTFGGKPLISWTIEEAKKCKYIDRIIVSTDDEQIADISKKYSAEVPFLRPKELSEDESPIIDAVYHLIDYLMKYEKYLPDFVALLQPTSPLRTYRDINIAFAHLLANKKANAVASITEVTEKPFWMRELSKDGFISYFLQHSFKDFRRQDLPLIYIVNGAVFICKTNALMNQLTFTPNKTLGYVMPRDRSIDIDELIDLKLAKLILSEKTNGEKNENFVSSL